MRHVATILISGVTAFSLSQCAPDGPASAPNPGAKAANQLDIAGNACGPTALLNAWRFGSTNCQSIAANLPGRDDRDQLRHLIIHYGGQRSNHIPQRNRWSRRGINAADLTDIANSAMKKYDVRNVVLIVPHGTNALAKTHQQWARSLRRGFPPVISLRRYEGAAVIESHFVTVLKVPDHLETRTSFFTMDYLDPMGARVCQGRIDEKTTTHHTQLIATTPLTPVGLSLTSGVSALVMDSMIVMP